MGRRLVTARLKKKCNAPFLLWSRERGVALGVADHSGRKVNLMCEVRQMPSGLSPMSMRANFRST